MMLFPLAQSVSYHYQVNGNPMVSLGGIACGLVFYLLLYGFVCYLLNADVKAIPPEYRREVTPEQAWLLMIPLFNLVWNFILFPRIVDSFAAYFTATGRPKPGDYGRGLSLWFAISAACSIVPCVNFLAAPAALVLLIILLVKFNGYKTEILAGGGGGFPVQPA